MPVSLSSSYFALQPLGISTSASKLLGVMREGSISCQMFIAVSPYFDLAFTYPVYFSILSRPPQEEKEIFSDFFTFFGKNFDFRGEVCYIVTVPAGRIRERLSGAKGNIFYKLDMR